MNLRRGIAGLLVAWVGFPFLTSTAETVTIDTERPATRWHLMDSPTEHVMIIHDQTAVLLAWGGQAGLESQLP